MKSWGEIKRVTLNAVCGPQVWTQTCFYYWTLPPPIINGKDPGGSGGQVEDGEEVWRDYLKRAPAQRRWLHVVLDFVCVLLRPVFNAALHKQTSIWVFSLVSCGQSFLISWWNPSFYFSSFTLRNRFFKLLNCFAAQSVLNLVLRQRRSLHVMRLIFFMDYTTVPTFFITFTIIGFFS